MQPPMGESLVHTSENSEAPSDVDVPVDEAGASDTPVRNAAHSTPFLTRLRQPANLIRISFVLTLIALLVYLTIDFASRGPVKQGLEKLLGKLIRLGFLGALLLVLVYALATVLMVPGLILTIGSGFVCTSAAQGNQLTGTLVATMVVVVGASTGASIAFVLGRYMLRATIGAWAQKYKILVAIEKAVQTNGFKVCFLLRLSPLIPFNLLNYVLGITSVRFTASLAACVGMLPGTMAYCFLGSTISSLSQVDKARGANKLVFTLLSVVGAIASIALVSLVTALARRELKRQLIEQPAEASEHEQAAQ